MAANQPQSVLPNVLAVVTAAATLLGALGGLIATVYAVGIANSGGAASTSSPTPAEIATASPAPTPRVTPTASARTSPTPAVIELAADADSWWGAPGTDEADEDHGPGEDERLVLDWGCSEDSRGNGNRRDCGSGLIAVRFDLGGLREGATIRDALLTLHAVEGGGEGMQVYARRATSEWNEEESATPECDSSEESAAEAADGDEWTWDVAALLEGERASGEQGFDLCFVLKEDAGVVFGSREGGGGPVLTITYE